MRRLACLTLIIGLVGLIGAPASQSAVFLGFSPASTAFSNGDALSLDIVVSGLAADNEIVSAFDLNVGYDSSLLSFTGATFGSDLGANPSSNLFDFTSEAYADYDDTIMGTVNIWSLSWLTDAQLDALQGDSVTLASLGFNALGSGDTADALNFAFGPGQDIKGLNAKPLDIVPEPGTFVLLVSGLACLVGLGLKNSRE